jgi:hypothetical protein
MSARLPAIGVCQLNLRRLSERVRQQAGSYRLEYAQLTGVLRPTRNVGALARDLGVSAKFTAAVRTRSPAGSYRLEYAQLTGVLAPTQNVGARLPAIGCVSDVYIGCDTPFASKPAPTDWSRCRNLQNDDHL